MERWFLYSNRAQILLRANKYMIVYKQDYI